VVVALRLVVGHVHGMARPATPFRLTLSSRPSCLCGCGRSRWRPACGCAFGACCCETRAGRCRRSPSGWRSARRPCGGRLGGSEAGGWTRWRRWRIGPALAARPGSASTTSRRSRPCLVRPPWPGGCGRRASWPRG